MASPESGFGFRVFPFALEAPGIADAIGVAGHGDHLCLIYESVEEQLAALVPYLRDGFTQGERCLYIVDSSTAADVEGWLEEAGIDVDAALVERRLVIADKRETYLRGGVFEPDAMIGLLANAGEEAVAEGFGGLRVTGEMSWMLGGEPGTDRLLEYEAKLNRFLPGSKVMAICQYQHRRFDPELIHDVIRTHPLVAVEDVVAHNDYFVPPEEFLEPDPRVRAEKQNARLLVSLVDRTRLDRHLRTVERRFELLVEGAAEGIWVVDADDTTVYVNQAMADMLGYSAAEMLGQPLAGFVDDPSQPSPPQSAGGSGGATERHELRLRRRDGAALWGLFATYPIHDESGRRQGAAAMVTDITRRRQVETELRTLSADLERRVELRTAELAGANEELEAFTYSVSHDLRTPIRAIAGFSNILLEEHADQLDGEGRRLLDVVIGATDRMGQLIDDLLALSRVGRVELRRTPVDHNQLVDDILVEIRAAEGGRVLDVEVGRLGTVPCDPSLLRQVWSNLLGNAAKFTRPRPRAHIEVTRRDEPGEVVFSVVDNGVGFDVRYADQLFKAFQRMHGQDEFEGTGIGLVTVARIVERHGGRVWADGELGRGAVFSFSLPAAEGRP